MATVILSVSETTQNWADQRQIPIVFTLQTGSTNDDAKKAALSETSEAGQITCHRPSNGRPRARQQHLARHRQWRRAAQHLVALSGKPSASHHGSAHWARAVSTRPMRCGRLLEWSLKAPNDLHLGWRIKSAGLLVESVSGGSDHRLLIGLGLNVLNHPRRFNEAEHLSKPLNSAPEEGEWFQFLDEMRSEFTAAIGEILKPALSPSACADLADALNANSSRTFTVSQVTPQGDLIHPQGKVRWIDL